MRKIESIIAAHNQPDLTCLLRMPALLDCERCILPNTLCRSHQAGGAM